MTLNANVLFHVPFSVSNRKQDVARLYLR